MWNAGFSILRLLFYGLAFAQAARHAHWYMALEERLTHVPYEPWVVQGVIALMFAIFLLLASGRLQFRHSSLRKLGELTYPLYLIHGAIGSTLLLYWVRDQGGNRWVALAVITLAAIALAWVIQRHVEKPLASRLRRFLKPWLVRQDAKGK